MSVPLPMSLPALETLLTAFVREECHKAGFFKGVVGVSGGLDSALTLLLTARALGPKNVLGVMMPYKTSSADSLTDAQAVIGVAGTKSETVEITKMIDAFAEVGGCDDPHRLGNKMARERMGILYDRAFRDSALVIGTSNKTELLLGYSTRFGDGAHDINPIGDLYKSQVRDLARHLDCPESILTKAPSADLWPGQTDEAEMGLSYDEVDRVLWYLVDQRGRPRKAATQLGLPKKTVDEVLRRVIRSQYKRNLPIICKVQARTVGIDFRFPRDWML